MDKTDKMITIIEDIAKGNYSNDIMTFAKDDNDENIRRISEAVGMMMVKVEAREYALQLMVDQLQELNDTIKKNALQTVSSIAKALGVRDEYTEGHAERVASYATRLATRLGLSQSEIHDIQVAGMLHDIGKIGFSDELFANTDSKLSDRMFAEICQHPTRGREILCELEFIGPAVDYVAAHHEKLDGTGYPLGLKGEEIPLGARILAVADCFDAITTTRSYQTARSCEAALEILNKLKENHLAPDLVEHFALELRENGMEGNLGQTEQNSIIYQ